MSGKKPSVGPRAIIKGAPPLIRHPWIFKKMALLQAGKWLLSLRPVRFSGGWAGPIRQLSVRVTERCNLRCRTCGQWGENGYLRQTPPAQVGRDEVGLARHVEVLEDLASRNWKPLYYLWGGEPFLYPHLVELIERSTRLGLPTSIATNGTGLADAAKALVRAPLFLAQISIDGPNARVHNRLRPSAGQGDSFATLEKGLESLARARKDQGGSLPLIASLTVISRENVGLLTDIYQTFKDRVDLFVFYLSWWIDRPGVEAHKRDFSRRFGFEPSVPESWIGDWRAMDHNLVADQVSSLCSASKGLSDPTVIFIPSIFGADDLRSYYQDHEKDFGYNRCLSIYQAAEIGPHGEVSPCRDYHDYVVGNIKENTLSELWNSGPYQKFRLSLAKEGLMPVCTRCCGLMGY